MTSRRVFYESFFFFERYLVCDCVYESVLTVLRYGILCMYVNVVNYTVTCTPTPALFSMWSSVRVPTQSGEFNRRLPVTLPDADPVYCILPAVYNEIAST